MKQIWRSLYLTILPLAILASFTRITTVRAQITPDKSLGAENSVVNPNAAIKGLPSTQIDGGATRGANLFHSFQEFNVDAGRGAYFSNPAGIQNILSRVTGGNPSNIFGTLGVLGKANLFFINPNGIIFGPNARLDVGGSFFASTANSLVFPNGFEFSATNPQAPPLLTVNIPIGLRFRDNPGSITNQSIGVDVNNNLVGLQVPSGNTLALVGGDVNLDGGRVTTAGGRVELGGLAQAGTVGLNADSSLSFPGGVTRGDVSLTNLARVDVSAEGGGSVAVNAQNFELSGRSLLLAGIKSGSTVAGAQAGDIVINATDKVQIQGDANSSSSITNQAGESSLGNAGDVLINTGTLEGIGSFQIGSATFGTGNAGRVSITATDKVSLQGLEESGSGVASLVGPSAKGNGSDIIINTRSLSLSNFAQLATSTLGQGNAGNIQVNASESMSVSGNSLIQAATFASGNPGNIIINAENAAVSFSGTGTGANTSVAGRSNSFGVDLVGTGQGGDITIKARSLSLTELDVAGCHLILIKPSQVTMFELIW